MNTQSRLFILAPPWNETHDKSTLPALEILSAARKIGYEAFLLTSTTCSHDVEATAWVKPVFPDRAASEQMPSGHTACRVSAAIAAFGGQGLSRASRFSRTITLRRRVHRFFTGMHTILYWLLPHILTEFCRCLVNTLKNQPPPFFWVWLCSAGNIAHYYHMREACEKAGIKPGDMLFFPEWGEEDLPPLALMLAWSTRKAKTDVTLVCNAPLGDIAQKKLTTRTAVAMLEQLVMEGKLFPVTEKMETAQQYAQSMALPLRVLPKIRYDSGDAFNTVENVARFIVRDTDVIKKPKEQIHALVVFPYPVNALQCSGPTHRVELLIAYLKKYNIIVDNYLYDTNDTNIAMTIGRTEKILSDFIFIPLMLIMYDIFKIHDMRFLYRHINYSGYKKFRIKYIQSVLENDVVFYETGYYIKSISTITKAMNIPTLATLHNLDFTRCNIKIISNHIKKIEYALQKQVDIIFTVSKIEQELLYKEKIKNILVPSSADIVSLQKNLRKFTTRTDDNALIFLFVGSNYYANNVAKHRILDMAQEALARNLPWQFRIIGGCGSPNASTDNVLMTGIISMEELHAYYAESDIILAPVSATESAGASVKTVEGLGSGRPFIGTTAVFRGLDVADGRECFIEDDPVHYVQRILDLLEQPDVLTGVAEKGRQFALAYDYRTAFRPYLDAVQTVTASQLLKRSGL